MMIPIVIDTSEEFLGLLNSSPEIQKKRDRTVGNFYFDRLERKIYCVGTKFNRQNEFTTFNSQLFDERYLWIPTQFSLQKICINEYRKKHEIIREQPDWVIQHLLLELMYYFAFNYPFPVVATTISQMWILTYYGKFQGLYWNNEKKGWSNLKDD